mmetsp:Transcript_13245/g.33439  ORF Transcript_13245/g.33439 Transcript_13245/m.33439 type:complete len:97 (-) Transcript_13245:1977-2267(-)
MSDETSDAKTSTSGSSRSRAEKGSDETDTEALRLNRMQATSKHANAATVEILSQPGASVAQTMNAASSDFSRSQKTPKVYVGSESSTFPLVTIMHI